MSCLHCICPTVADLADLASLPHQVELQVQVHHVVEEQQGDPPAKIPASETSETKPRIAAGRPTLVDMASCWLLQTFSREHRALQVYIKPFYTLSCLGFSRPCMDTQNSIDGSTRGAHL